MADGGYTPSEVDRFTLADAVLLFNRWSDYPPIRVLLAGFLGVKPPSRNTPALSAATTSIAALRLMFPDGVMRG